MSFSSQVLWRFEVLVAPCVLLICNIQAYIGVFYFLGPLENRSRSSRPDVLVKDMLRKPQSES